MTADLIVRILAMMAAIAFSLTMVAIAGHQADRAAKRNYKADHER